MDLAPWYLPLDIDWLDSLSSFQPVVSREDARGIRILGRDVTWSRHYHQSYKDNMAPRRANDLDLAPEPSQVDDPDSIGVVN